LVPQSNAILERMIVKLFSETRGVTWRASCGLLTGALALASAACAGGGATAMSPSAATSANLNASCGDTGGLRKFRMTVTPDTLPTPGPAKITVVITNDATSNCNQGLGSAQFTVPAGLNFVSIDSMTVSGGKAWSNSVNGPTILVGANNGTQKLVPSESVTLVLNVNPTACGVNTFDVAVATAWTAPFSGVKTDTFGYLGMAPKVTVTGCAPAPTVSCTDRHAPAVANDYVRNVLGIAPNEIPGSIYGAMIHEIGQLTAEDGTFQGLTPCQHPAYDNAVIAYIQNWISTHSS